MDKIILEAQYPFTKKWQQANDQMNKTVYVVTGIINLSLNISFP